MASDDVWMQLQPKVSNKRFSSSLSQISNFSLGSQSRLSLSCRTSSSQVQPETKNALASSPNDPQKRSSIPRPTLNLSPIQTTPSPSRKRATPKRNTPQDGLVQKKIESYFGSGTKKNATPLMISDVEIVDLTCDDQKDEGTPKTGRLGLSNQSPKTMEKPNVSRVLFPQSCHISSERTKELDVDCNSSIRGKENLNANSCPSTKLKDSEKSLESPVYVFKPPRTFKYKVATVHHINISTNHAKDTSNASDLANPSSQTTSSSVGINETSKKNEMGNDKSRSPNAKGNEDTSSVPSDSKGGEYSVKVPKGKKNLVRKKNVETDSIKIICSTQNNTEKTGSSTRDPQLRTTHETESFDNFTGVTECVTVQSSGEMWTPRHKRVSTSSDSDDFERELLAMRQKKSSKKKSPFQNVQNKNLKKKMTASGLKELVNNIEKSKSLQANTTKVNKEAKMSHSEKSVVEKELPGSSRSAKKGESNKKVQESLEEDFTLSGGFFPNDDDNEKTPGQAFVIKSPSQEYLTCWNDLMEDSSITVEHEKVTSDSEKSSILADLSVIDQRYNESIASVQTSSTVTPNDGNDTRRDNLSISSVELPEENNPTLPYHCNLSGVSLSTSQWNNIPYNQESLGINVDRNPKTLLEKNYHLTPSASSPRIQPTNETQVFSDGYNKRASSPHEAEVAPNNVGFGVRSRNAQLLETSPEKALMNACLTSQANSVSSEIGYPSKEILHEEHNSCDELPHLERVQEWISNTTKNDLTSDSGRNQHKGASHTKQKITQHYTVSKHNPGSNKKWSEKRYKSCNIKCQVKIFVKSNASTNDSVIQNIRRMRCMKGNAPPNRENQKTAGVLDVVVQEITSSDIQKSKKTDSHHEALSSVMDFVEKEISSESQSSRKIPIKVEVKYGKWGWEEIGVDCMGEVNNHSNNNPGVSATFCVEEMTINICHCSRYMQVDCIINKETLPRSDYVCRSTYSTSLMNYVSHWGLADNPITLSVVAYSKLFNSTLEDSFCSSVPCSEKDTIIISCGQFDSQSSIDFHDTLNSSSQMTRDSHNLNSTAKGRKELSQDSESDEQSTPSGLSDDFQEWMTQPMEAEPDKVDAASKWKDLMQKMRSGSSAKSSSSSSVSSLSSVTSQGTSGGEQSWGRRQHGRERKPRSCPFYKIVRGTTFAVDAFSYGAISGITHYFLSHFHYDHYMGLSKKFTHPIYCSSVTARLVDLKLKVNPSLLRRLDPGQTVKVENARVTALDANHCPGSVMFLFELPNGKTHLHCGDFRAHPCMESYHALWNVDIDQLYLDTTYCDPTYNFPPQQDIIKDILTIVSEELENEPKTLIVCGSYTIGKERVFAAVAEKLKAKIWAPYDKYRVLQCVKEGLQDLSSCNVDVEGGAGRELGLVQALSLLTKVKEEAQVHVLPMAYLKKKVLEEHLYSLKGMVFNKILAFRPTGWAHGRTKGTSLVLNSPVIKLYDAAYSEHSSFSEMARFVKFIRPKQVVKTVNVGSPRKRQSMEKYINSWLATANSKVPIPDKNNESPKSAKVMAEQKQAGVFEPRGSLKTKLSSRTTCLHSSSLTLETPGYAASSIQTTLSQSQPQRNECCHSNSRVAVKRTSSISEVSAKRRLI